MKTLKVIWMAARLVASGHLPYLHVNVDAKYPPHHWSICWYIPRHISSEEHVPWQSYDEIPF